LESPIQISTDVNLDRYLMVTVRDVSVLLVMDFIMVHVKFVRYFRGDILRMDYAISVPIMEDISMGNVCVIIG
jgi:hypothetical protein